MSRRMKKSLIAVAALAAMALGAAALVQASGESGESGEAEDAVVTGAQADKAKAAALRVTKGGTVNAVERDGAHGATWEVEITKPNGATVDIYLDEQLEFVADEGDGGEGENEGS